MGFSHICAQTHVIQEAPYRCPGPGPAQSVKNQGLGRVLLTLHCLWSIRRADQLLLGSYSRDLFFGHSHPGHPGSGRIARSRAVSHNLLRAQVLRCCLSLSPLSAQNQTMLEGYFEQWNHQQKAQNMKEKNLALNIPATRTLISSMRIETRRQSIPWFNLKWEQARWVTQIIQHSAHMQKCLK